MTGEDVRWGILSTANIVRGSFLPALRAAGGGRAYAVASRDAARAQTFAREQGIDRAIEGYEALLSLDDVDAVYIALPNSLHAHWTMEALRAGKAVLCEKPLCTSVAETEEVLQVARETGAYLWEAFVFPFHRQMARVEELLRGGAIGSVREIQSNFHFRLGRRNDIRLSPELGGGALNDVGCYCVRLGRLILGEVTSGAAALARWSEEGVDEEMDGVLGFDHEARLLLSCGMARPVDTFARIIGDEGEIRLTHPFHPGREDEIELRARDAIDVEGSGQVEPSFTPALRHIHAVLRGQEEPRHLAEKDALGNAVALDLLHAAARSAR